MEPYFGSANFTALLHSQVGSQSSENLSDSMGLDASQVPDFSTQVPDTVEKKADGRKKRRKWSQTEDIVLCSAWLNTSKDAVIRNEQRLSAFWKCIGAYFNASPKLVRYSKREPRNCKQRWHKINDSVCKFVGCYNLAQRQKSSGQKNSDVLQLTYALYLQDQKVNFNLQHVWMELLHDQKWSSSFGKANGKTKKKKLDGQSASSKTGAEDHDEAVDRPEGVKAAKVKAKAKATVTNSGNVNTKTVTLSEYHSI